MMMNAPTTAMATTMRLRLVLLLGFYCDIFHSQLGLLYVNWHYNAGVGGVANTIFYPTNREKQFLLLLPKPREIQSDEFRYGLHALQRIVQRAQRDDRRLRPIGSRWSVTELPYSSDYMIDTHHLDYAQIGIDNSDFVTSNYQKDSKQRERLVFAQCGCRVKYLYDALFEQGLTLSTSGSSDGQTMAGAISTGVHNAAILFGGMQDYVKGIHLILGDRMVFLQRASDPVVTQAYIDEFLDQYNDEEDDDDEEDDEEDDDEDDDDELDQNDTFNKNTELIEDDDLFNAAVVGMGTFGIVHGYVLEAEPLFRLRSQVVRKKFDNALPLMASLDLESLGFTNIPTSDGSLPWHFEAMVNPYELDRQRGTALRIMERIPLSDDQIDEVKATANSYEPTYYAKGGLMLALGEQVTDNPAYKLPTNYFNLADSSEQQALNQVNRALFALIANGSINQMLRYGSNRNILTGDDEEKEAYPHEMYGDPLSAGEFTAIPLSTTAMQPCVPIGDLEIALPLILDVLYDYPTPTALHIRWLASSNATLVHNSFDGITVCIGLNSIDSIETRQAYTKIQEALEAERGTINFSYHWGKVLPLNNAWAVESFGSDTLLKWKTQRKKLLTTKDEQRLFSNDYTDALGLT